MAKFTQDETNHIISVCDRVWQAIGQDSLACAEECGEALDNESCIEGILDADRPTMYAKPDPAIWSKFTALGWSKMTKFVSSHRRYA